MTVCQTDTLPLPPTGALSCQTAVCQTDTLPLPQTGALSCQTAVCQTDTLPLPPTGALSCQADDSLSNRRTDTATDRRTELSDCSLSNRHTAAATDWRHTSWLHHCMQIAQCINQIYIVYHLKQCHMSTHEYDETDTINFRMRCCIEKQKIIAK